jgi:hypothetical protein
MGRSGTGTVIIEPAGPTAAFSATVASNIRTWMRAAGFLATVDTTPGVEKETFTPHAVDAEESITFEAYERGHKYPLAGVYSNFKLSCDMPGIPVADSAIRDCSPRCRVTPRAGDPHPWGAGEVRASTHGDIGATRLRWAAQERDRGGPQHRRARPRQHHADARRLQRRRRADHHARGDRRGGGLDAGRRTSRGGFNIFELMERQRMALAFGWGRAQYNATTSAAATAQLIESLEQEEGPPRQGVAELKPRR